MYENMTVSQLRKHARSMNPQPATGVAISGANKQQLLAWLDGCYPNRTEPTPNPEPTPDPSVTEQTILTHKDPTTGESGYVVHQPQPTGDKALQTTVYGHAELAESLAKALAGHMPASAPAPTTPALDEARIKELIEEHSPKPKTIKVEHFDGSKIEVGAHHKDFHILLLLASQRIPVFLAGPSGSGKTHTASQLAEALKLPFEAISVGPMTTKGDLLGYKNVFPEGPSYFDTGLTRCFKNGGVFLIDEIDAGNAGVLTVLNMALSNGSMATPEGMIDKHPDFICIAGANTYGTGADRQYVGRTQLDEATLKRFFVLEWPIDTDLENQISGADDDKSRKLVEKIQELRVNADNLKLRVTVSPRDSIYAVRLLKAGMKQKQILKGLIFKNLDDATVTKLQKGE